MLITNAKGLYTIKFDSVKNLAYEVPVGVWTKEDYIEYHSQFENKLGPATSNKPWVIISDLRKYKVSDLGDVMAKHGDWLNNNNLQYSAVIVDSAIVKMQINRAMGGSKFTQQAFLSEEEAVEWLQSKGF